MPDVRTGQTQVQIVPSSGAEVLSDASGRILVSLQDSALHATDLVTTEPKLAVMGGWDYENQVVRSVLIEKKNGLNSIITHDPLVRRILERIFVLLEDESEEVAKNLAVELDVHNNSFDTYSFVAAATTNAATILQQKGSVKGWYLYNASSFIRYIKFYDKATPPTVGTDIPSLRIALPAGAAANVFSDAGLTFDQGISIATTTGIADTDATAVSASDLVVNIFYTGVQ